MASVASITAEPYNIPLLGTLKWGKGHQLAYLNHVLVTVTLSDGSVGQAEATPRPSIYGETQASILHIAQEHLAPLLATHTLKTRADVDDLDVILHHIKGNQTAKGALNIALHHAVAQSAGQTLAECLGVKTDSTEVSYIVSTGSLEAVLADVDSIYQQGVRVFKVKIGMDIPQEIATIRQLIATFPKAKFYVDANQCLTIDNAPSVLNQLYEMGVLYCEEPLPVHQVHERQHLRQQTAMPIITDDSCFTVGDVQRELALDTFDIVNIKTARTGFSQSALIAKLAREHDKQVMVGSQASSLMGCQHAALFAMSVDSECATEATFYLKTNSHQARPQIDDGQLRLDALVKNVHLS
ncbi:MAG: enolase C-terminal domain-like protein [Chloroflexota bacterium]